MGKQRKIIHIDMDCFFAAVEVRDRPELKGKPVAVGGNAESRGVVAAANYEARKYGVKSAISSRRAVEMCPDLVLVRPSMNKYRAESQKIRAIFREYTELVEPLSLDEAYLDVTECKKYDGSATIIAREIRDKIWEQTSLTASAGIAPNKFLAKVASDWKKPNGQFTIKPEEVLDFVKKLKVRKIPGVGKVTAAKMNQLGIHSCEDLQRLTETELFQKFGSWGRALYKTARGIDNRPVVTDWQRKSLSVENTFSTDLATLEEIKIKTSDLFDELQRRLSKSDVDEALIKGQVVKLRFSDFTTTTHEKAAKGYPLKETYDQLIAERLDSPDWSGVRLLGLGVRLGGERPKVDEAQLSFFAE